MIENVHAYTAEVAADLDIAVRSFETHSEFAPPQVRLLLHDGGNIRFVFGGYRVSERDRVHITASPQEAGGRSGELTTISVSDTKSPQTVAGDINRRLLPSYRVNLATAIAAHQAKQADRARLGALRAQLLTADPRSTLHVIEHSPDTLAVHADTVRGRVVLRNRAHHVTLTIEDDCLLRFLVALIRAAEHPATPTSPAAPDELHQSGDGDGQTGTRSEHEHAA